MRTIQDYLKKELGYVNKWWKYLFLFCLFDFILFVSLLFCFYSGTGDLGEWYFEINNRVFYIGFME